MLLIIPALIVAGFSLAYVLLGGFTAFFVSLLVIALVILAKLPTKD